MPDGMSHHAGEAPPPYSETDIYSNSGAQPSPHPSVGSARGYAPTDDGAASRMSESTGDIIYTPPLTPRTSSHQSESHANRPSPASGASFYFDSRPVQAPSPPGELLVHTVRINSTSLPDDLPYQREWAGRDVTSQDWATFVNYLLPDHTTRGNEAVRERKLRAEDSRNDAASVASSGRSQAEAQLDQMRGSQASTSRSRANLEATVREWNAGFFGPRGINVRLEPDERMPGSWDTSFENADGNKNNNTQQPRNNAPPTGWMSRMTMNNDGVRYGNSFVADSKGLRIGNLILDSDGIRMGGNEPAAGPSGCKSRDMGGPSRSHGWGDHHHHGHGHGGRGRGRYPNDGKQRRDRSSSTSSSSSSSSNSSASIGSLPDYDDVKDHQLPLYAERLREWNAHPQQFRTKNDVKQLKAELKAGRNASPLPDPNFDKKSLRMQVKGLTQQWKSIKKSQRQTRRAHRRERKQRRRAERRERKHVRKEMHRARKEHRRHGPMPAPAVPPVPPMPPVPPAPHAEPFSSPWGGGRGRGYGGSFCGPSRGFFGGGFGRGGRGFGGGGRGRGGFGFFGGGGPPMFNQPTEFGTREMPPGVAAAPGAWPQQSGIATPPPGSESAAKYRRVEELESELTEKEGKLAGLDDGDGSKKALAKEVEALTEKLEFLQMEADEAYAKEIAAAEA